MPGRTLQFVMNHIANGGSLLTAAPAPALDATVGPVGTVHDAVLAALHGVLAPFFLPLVVVALLCLVFSAHGETGPFMMELIAA